jgi:rhodanese-related sulfurtransferase
MSKTQSASSARDQRVTVLTAIGTFAAFSVITIVAWSLTRKPAPEPAAAPVTAPAAAPASAAAAMPDTFETIAITEFKKAVDAGQVTVIDVRSIEQYMASHIPGSLHIPVSRIEGEIPYLPKDKPIITYCTCPAEESSGQAAMILVRGGISSRALKGGLDAWTSLGYPVEQGVK